LFGEVASDEATGSFG